jgi:hypothetical protein
MPRDGNKPLILEEPKDQDLSRGSFGAERRVRDAIARQAYRLFESHGASPGSDAKDSEQTESEVVRPLECGLISA